MINNMFIEMLNENLPVYVKEHSIRVAKYAVILYDLVLKSNKFEDIFLSEDAIDLMHTAAYYHDIGKILTMEDDDDKSLFGSDEAIINHTMATTQIFEDLKNNYVSSKSVAMSIACALFHHEHWDGTGLPCHLFGESIPIVARITAICNAYDIMSYNISVSRPDKLHTSACEYISKWSGTKFDPEIANLFTENESYFKEQLFKFLKVGIK